MESETRIPQVTHSNIYQKVTGLAFYPMSDLKSESNSSQPRIKIKEKIPKIPQKRVEIETEVSSISNNSHLTQFELSSTKVANDEEEATECLQCLWPFLRLWRLIGMCPITKHGNHLIVPTKFYSPC